MVTAKDRKLLGQGVRKYRNIAGLTIEKLAEKADLNPVYLGQIERGLKVPTIDALQRISRALSVRVKDVLESL